MPPHPWLGLSTAVAAPLLFLVIAWETGLFWGFGIPVGSGVSVPVGFVLLAVAAFPLMMPPDVRYLAAVVSMALMCVLALPLILDTGLFLVPVIILLFFVWATNHPTFMKNIQGSADTEDSEGSEDTEGRG